MSRKLVEIYEDIQNFNHQKPAMEHGQKLLNRRVEDAKENISSAINGLMNYYRLLERNIEKNQLDVGAVEVLEQFEQFTRKQLSQFSQFKSAEESFE
jgi:hypothetical protein